MNKDWRLVKQENYLFGKSLTKKKFIPIGQCDHAHCAFCWEKFGQDDNWLSIGYCTYDGHHWICEQCYQDFKEKFEWNVSKKG